MSDRYPGGIITKTPVVPSGPYEDSTAPGIWTLEQQAYWQAQGLWPTAGSTNPGDPYYKYVTMLLTGNGTNGAQNNTFLDSSSNAFTITRNGNTTQGSFSPYGSLWSNYFNGTTDKLISASNANLNFSTGDFTIEGWSYCPVADYSHVFEYTLYSTGILFTWYSNSGGTSLTQSRIIINGTSYVFNYVPPAGQWIHFAIVRSSGVIKVYVNGVEQTSINYSSSLPSSGTASMALACLQSPAQYSNIYLSNIRVVKSAVYTSAFTPSTTPLTAITNTQLLTCQSNRFIDNSANAITLTPTGTPSVQRFSPFNPTASYSTATIGGSGYFDGSTDYLTVADNAALELGTSDFTLECWFYATAQGSNLGLIAKGWHAGVYGSYVISYNDGALVFDASSTNSSWDMFSEISITNTLVKNQWNHIAVTREGSTFRFYLNGVRTNTGTSSASFYNGTGVLAIGAGDNGQGGVTGYISDVRLVKGTALYTGTTYTIPTSPLTAVSNTSLLTNMTNAGIPDSAMMNDLETVGNAQVSTSQSKFGGSSMYFDGTGDYLKGVSNPIYAFGKGDFTIECWIYLPTTPSGDYACILDTRTAGGSSSNSILFAVNSGLGITVDPGISTSGNFTTNTWYHVALCQASGVMVAYVNGTSVASYTNTADRTTTGCYIGQVVDAAHPAFNGYIDDLRITKGYARYTANFTPPTSAFYTY